MTNLNSMKIQSSSSKISKLVNNISKTCNSLFEVFEKFMDAVSTYTGTTVKKMSKWIHSLLVDRIMNKIFRLKDYLKELNLAIQNGQINEKEWTTIASSLIESKDEIIRKMQKNNFLYNNFGFLLNEVNGMIDENLNLMVVR